VALQLRSLPAKLSAAKWYKSWPNVEFD